MTRAPLGSKVKRLPLGSAAATYVAPGFQPFIPALTTCWSLDFPRFLPYPKTLIEKVELEGHAVGPVDVVLDGEATRAELTIVELDKDTAGEDTRTEELSVAYDALLEDDVDGAEVSDVDSLDGLDMVEAHEEVEVIGSEEATSDDKSTILDTWIDDDGIAMADDDATSVVGKDTALLESNADETDGVGSIGKIVLDKESKWLVAEVSINIELVWGGIGEVEDIAEVDETVTDDSITELGLTATIELLRLTVDPTAIDEELIERADDEAWTEEVGSVTDDELWINELVEACEDDGIDRVDELVFDEMSLDVGNAVELTREAGVDANCEKDCDVDDDTPLRDGTGLPQRPNPDWQESIAQWSDSISKGCIWRNTRIIYLLLSRTTSCNHVSIECDYAHIEELTIDCSNFQIHSLDRFCHHGTVHIAHLKRWTVSRLQLKTKCCVSQLQYETQLMRIWQQQGKSQTWSGTRPYSMHSCCRTWRS
jgi:hypothetical protein